MINSFFSVIARTHTETHTYGRTGPGAQGNDSKAQVKSTKCFITELDNCNFKLKIMYRNDI